MRRAATWIVATALVAAAVHAGSVLLLPRAIMWRTMGVIGRGGVNLMLHGKRPTAEARGVVRPSPDLLYSSCVFDLSKGPVRVTARRMPDTYWSVSLFDDETNNFYVINDRQARDGAVDFTIVPPGRKKITNDIVVSPSTRGLVLLRTLISDEAKFAQIDAARRHATCGVAR